MPQDAGAAFGFEQHPALGGAAIEKKRQMGAMQGAV